MRLRSVTGLTVYSKWSGLKMIQLQRWWVFYTLTEYSSYTCMGTICISTSMASSLVIVISIKKKKKLILIVQNRRSSLEDLSVQQIPPQWWECTCTVWYIHLLQSNTQLTYCHCLICKMHCINMVSLAFHNKSIHLHVCIFGWFYLKPPSTERLLLS